MIKDYLKENQPLFYRIIENEFNLKKIPHAFLLVGNNTDQPLQFLTMSDRKSTRLNSSHASKSRMPSSA